MTIRRIARKTSDARQPETAGASLVRVVQAKKRYGATLALDGVDLDVRSGQIHAVLGQNGSGKSTLVRLLAGVEGAEAEGSLISGGISSRLSQWTPVHARGYGLRFVHQDPAVFPDLSVSENLAIGRRYPVSAYGRIRWKQLRKEGLNLLEQFGLEAVSDKEIGEISPAERTIVAIVRALNDIPENRKGTFVLDEPTAALGGDESHAVVEAMRSLRGEGHGVIFVTHRAEEVFEAADWVTVLRNGRVVLSRAVDGLPPRKMIQAIVGREIKESTSRAPRDEARPLLKLANISCGPIREASVEISTGEVVGLSGLMGSGASDILRCIFGAQAPSSGSISFEGESAPAVPAGAISGGIAYVPADRAGDALFPDLDVAENITAASVRKYSVHHRLRHRHEIGACRVFIERYGIRPPNPFRPVSTLSGGNQQKVVLARWLSMEPKLLLLDDPTQGVDIGAKAEIWSMILRYVEQGMAVVVASTDTEELAKYCDRVLIIRSGRLSDAIPRGELTAARVSALTHGIQRA